MQEDVPTAQPTRGARAPRTRWHLEARLRALPGAAVWLLKGFPVGSVIKKRRKRMAKKKHRKLLKKTRVQRRKLGK